MGKTPPDNSGVPGAPAEAPPLANAIQGETQAETQDVAEAILKHLQTLGDAVAPSVAAADEASPSQDDLLPTALGDLAPHNIEQALDQLANSPDLFDLPTLDFGGDGGSGDS